LELTAAGDQVSENDFEVTAIQADALTNTERLCDQGRGCTGHSAEIEGVVNDSMLRVGGLVLFADVVRSWNEEGMSNRRCCNAADRNRTTTGMT